MAKIITLSGVVGWEITARSLKNQLVKNDINILKVDSEGGSVFEANRLFNVIKDFLKDNPGSIKVEFGALAASAASYFPLAVGVENVSVRENTTFMAHKAWLFTWGNSDELLRDAEILDGLDRIIAKIYMEFTGKDIDETLDIMKNELWIIGGAEIVAAGFASEVISSEDSTVSNVIVEKSEILARIKEAEDKLRDSGVEEDLNKWAAKLRKAEIISDSSGSPDNINNGSNPVTGKNKISEEDVKLTFEEYLDQNPAAKAKFETLRNDAVEAGVKASIDDERKRVSDFVALSGLKLPENIVKAIEDGDSAADFALNEIKEKNKTSNESESDDLGGIKPLDQLPKGGKKSGEEVDNETKKSVSDYIDKKKRR